MHRCAQRSLPDQHHMFWPFPTYAEPPEVGHVPGFSSNSYAAATACVLLSHQEGVSCTEAFPGKQT